MKKKKKFVFLVSQFFFREREREREREGNYWPSGRCVLQLNLWLRLPSSNTNASSKAFVKPETLTVSMATKHRRRKERRS